MKDKIAKIKRNMYEQCLFNYGKIPYLMLLHEREKEEHYEECKIMIEAIEFMNEHHYYFKTHPIPTKFKSWLFDEFRESMAEYGMTGETAIGNFPYYIDYIRKDVTVGEIDVIDNYK